MQRKQKYPTLLSLIFLSLTAFAETLPETERSIALRLLNSTQQASDVIRTSLLTVKEKQPSVTYVEKRIQVAELFYKVQSCQEKANAAKNSQIFCRNLGVFSTLAEAQAVAEAAEGTDAVIIEFTRRVAQTVSVPQIRWELVIPTNAQVLADLESNAQFAADLDSKAAKLCNQVKIGSKSGDGDTQSPGPLEFVENTLREELYKGKYVLMVDTKCSARQ